ncbi:MAG: hypothetical protein AAF483_24515 [Planctomycetota bacterium]
MADDMKICNMAPRAIDTYTYQISRSEDFLQAKGKHPAEATPEEVREPFELERADPQAQVGEVGSLHRAASERRLQARAYCALLGPLS